MKIPTPDLNLQVIAPELIVLATALLLMIADLLFGKPWRKGLAWLALCGVVVAAGVSYYIWDGPEPVLQEMLAADGYALYLKLLILATAALAILFSVEYVERTGLAQAEYYTLLLLSTAGMMLMTEAVNLVTIFLGLEILSISLYVMVGLNRAEPRSAEAAMKYFLLGAIASAFLLYGMALLYGQVSSTSLAAIRDFVGSRPTHVPALLLVGLGLMLVGFGFKLALVPFQMWAPDVYQGAPTSVTAFMSAGAKLAGFAALARVCLHAFGPIQGHWQPLLAAMAALTMTVGNLAALRQQNLKRLLAYSGIAQAGYILVGLAAGSEMGTAGALFYLLVYVFMNTAAFAVVIAVSRMDGSPDSAETVDGLTGLAVRKPALAAAMALFMLSLTGLPPLAGFLGKLFVFGPAVQAGLTWLVVVGVINSAIAAYYYLRIVAAMYLKHPGVHEKSREPICPALMAGLALAVLALLVLGLFPAPIVELARMSVAALLGG